MDWDLSKSNWKASHPLGKAAEQFILENPEWVVYLRRNHRFPCITCYDFSSRSVNSNTLLCSSCFGTGYNLTKIITPVRFWAGGQISTREQDVLDDAGNIARWPDTVAVCRELYPEEGDMILRAQWNVSTREIGTNPKAKPVRFIASMLVRLVNVNYEQEVSFMQCGIRSYEVNIDYFYKTLRSLGGFEKIVPSGKWPTTDW